jgi:hypothetical protein
LVCDGKSFKADNFAKAAAAIEDGKKAPAGSADKGGLSGKKGCAPVPSSCVRWKRTVVRHRRYTAL